MRYINNKPRVNLFFSVNAVFTMLALMVVLLTSCSGIKTEPEPPYILAESWGGKGNTAAKFNEPTGIAVTNDEVFVRDRKSVV